MRPEVKEILKINNMERKVGEKFEINNITLKVIEKTNCDECHFNNSQINCGFEITRNIIGPCHPNFRSDNKSVIFKEIK